MSFNIPTFSIPGMMPTTHPVTESIYWTDPFGAVDLVFSTSESEPEFVSFRITDYAGRVLLQDDAGAYYVRDGENNKFVFGSDTAGYIPSGTWILWVKQDGVVSKLYVRNTDTAFNKGLNRAVEGLVEEPVAEADNSVGTYNCPPVIKGDTFPGIGMIRIKISGEPPPNTLVSARLQFRSVLGSTGTPSLELSTDSGGIVITSSTLWEMNIPAFVVNLAAGTYYYDLETQDDEGTIRTYLKGSWTIINDTTH